MQFNSVLVEIQCLTGESGVCYSMFNTDVALANKKGSNIRKDLASIESIRKKKNNFPMKMFRFEIQADGNYRDRRNKVRKHWFQSLWLRFKVGNVYISKLYSK